MARRLRRDYGVFGAAADRSRECRDSLAALVPDGGELWIVDAEAYPVPLGTRLLAPPEPVVQMVCEALVVDTLPQLEMLDLTEADAPSMFELATLTKPGPYLARTNQLGEFVGVKRGGRLVAMTGERMRLPGFAEVSGVCTHPDYRGQGFAGALVRSVAKRMIAKGETPFLHVHAENFHALALYESVGFCYRSTLIVSVLVRD